MRDLPIVILNRAALGGPAPAYWQVAQFEAAALPQIPSHWLLQQKGSLSQIPASQKLSLQPGVPFELQQSLPPGPLAPHTVQLLIAALAQIPSHWLLQQKASLPHTLAVQKLSSQPGDPLPPLVQQSLFEGGLPPQTEQMSAAAPAQRLSHWLLQQNESAAHTSAWQVPSLQPGVLLRLSAQQSLGG